MAISNFPSGFKDGVTIKGVPLALSNPGEVFFVSNADVLMDKNQSVAGADSTSAGTFQRPFRTIDYAIGQCVANRGDIIFVKPGHAETLSTASAITADVAGVTIIGLGSGADRPTLTFSATAATMVISANSVTVQNIITKPSIDSVVSPIVVSGSDCWLEIEHQDASATVEAVRAILTTAGADRLYVDLKYRGFIAGNAVVNAVRLVGVDTGYINVDFYGVASTSIVEFHTTACHNIIVKGTHYNSGTVDLSKNVVDTVTGSTWSVSAYDATAAASYSGGSAQAVAADDVGAVSTAVSAVASAVAVIDAFHDVPTADVATNAQMRDVIGNKTDAAVEVATTDKSLMAYTKAMVDRMTPQIAIKASGDLTAFGTSLNLFTVTGDVLVKAGASVNTAVTSTSGTTTLSVGVAGNTACLIVQDAVDGTAFAIGDSWTLDTAADANGALVSAEWTLVGNGATIILTGSVDDITAGAIDFYCLWMPLSVGSSVVAA